MVRRAYQPSQGEKPKEDYDLVETKFLLHKKKMAKVPSHSFSLVNNFFEKRFIQFKKNAGCKFIVVFLIKTRIRKSTDAFLLELLF